ncbi:hypothetical protein L9F63_019062, partial [Diploptera punctata]
SNLFLDILFKLLSFTYFKSGFSNRIYFKDVIWAGFALGGPTCNLGGCGVFVANYLEFST